MSEQDSCVLVSCRKLERMFEIIDKAQSKKVCFDENIETMRKQVIKNMNSYLELLRNEIQECIKQEGVENV